MTTNMATNITTTIVRNSRELMIALAKLSADNQISDIHLNAGEIIKVRKTGQLTLTQLQICPNGANEELGVIGKALSEWTGRQITKAMILDGYDCRLSHPDLGDTMLRCNLTYSSGQCKETLVIRVARKFPPIEQNFKGKQLEFLVSICKNTAGLVLVAGPTGSGKTTTLYGMLQTIADTLPVNLLTVEDPIESTLISRVGNVVQQEIGTDITSFENAMKALLRRDPDVILFGEIRDAETAMKALEASNTGHLVFATVHVDSASEAAERIVNFFPPERKSQTTDLLASTLIAVIHQTLVKREIDPPRDQEDSEKLPGRIAVLDILYASQNVKTTLRNAKDTSGSNQGLSHSLLANGQRSRDCFTRNRALAALVTSGYISEETAIGMSQGEPSQTVSDLLIASPMTYSEYINNTSGYGKHS